MMKPFFRGLFSNQLGKIRYSAGEWLVMRIGFADKELNRAAIEYGLHQTDSPIDRAATALLFLERELEAVVERSATLTSVRARLANELRWAETIGELTRDHPNARVSWQDVAGVLAEHPHRQPGPGKRMPPHEGLVKTEAPSEAPDLVLEQLT